MSPSSTLRDFLLRRLQWGLFAVGVCLALLWLRAEGESLAFQSAESSRLDATLRPETGAPASKASRNAGASRRRALGRLEIPRLGISVMVAEGIDPRILVRAVGHIPSTAAPGAAGNFALAGHRDTYFKDLDRVRRNDVIRFVTSKRVHTYRVRWGAVVEPDRVDVLNDTATPSLTLVTCYPFTWTGTAPRRFVVRAERIQSRSMEEVPS